MSHHLILLCHATPAVAPMFGAAAAGKGLDVDVVPIRSPYAGASAAYDHLAQSVLREGRVLPGLLAKYKAPRQGYASTWLVCWSGSYALARAMRPADRAELAGLVLLDGGHTTLDRDKTASDAGVQWLVDWAREAKAGRSTLWIGHTDVRTYGDVASTTQVAAEVLRLAGGPGGRFVVVAKDVCKDDKAEHIAARDGWGPTFVADAMASALLGAAPAEERETPEPPATERDPKAKPRPLRRSDRGDDVTAWAQRLLDLGYDPGGLDGTFGPALDRATREFQGDAHLAADGIVGPKTRAAAEMMRPRPAPAPPPVGFVERFVARAHADLDAKVRETSHNDGPRIRQYLATCGLEAPNEYCAAAITTWLREAADEAGTEPPIQGSAGAQVLMHQLRKAGRWCDAQELVRDPSKVRRGMIGVCRRGPPGTWQGHAFMIDGPAAGTTFPTVEANGAPRGDGVTDSRRDLRDPTLFGAGWVD